MHAFTDRVLAVFLLAGKDKGMGDEPAASMGGSDAAVGQQQHKTLALYVWYATSVVTYAHDRAYDALTNLGETTCPRAPHTHTQRKRRISSP